MKNYFFFPWCWTDAEPECDPNGTFHYPCVMVHQDWKFLSLFIIIFKQSGNDSWFINNGNNDGFENGLFTPHGATTNINTAIIATDTIAGGDIFGDI